MTQIKLVLRTQSGERHLAVDFDDEATVGQLADRLAGRLAPDDTTPCTLERISRGRAALARDARLARQSLRSGDAVSLVADAGHRESAVTAARLRIDTPELPPRVVEVARGDTVVGRAPTCDLQVDDRLASRRHAKLMAGDVLEVVDLGATNVTLVNGTPATSPRRLRTGDRVRVGDTVLTVEHADDVAAGTDSGGPTSSSTDHPGPPFPTRVST